MKEGKVSGVFERKFNQTKIYSFQIEGSARYYRLGENKPTFEPGAFIKFDDTQGVVPIDTVEQIESPKAIPEPSGDTQTIASTEHGGAASDVGKRMQYQAARKDATALVVAALHCDHLPHPANTKKGERFGLLLGYVEQVTKQLLEKENGND